MAIENEDLLVLQKGGGGDLRKASVAALLAQVAIPDTPTLDEVTTAGNNSETGITIGPDGTPTIELNEGGNIVADGSVTADFLIGNTNITSGGSIVASDSIQAINKIHAGAGDSPVQITLDGTTGEIGGGEDAFIDGGTYA